MVTSKEISPKETHNDGAVDHSYESAVRALLTPGMHQATTKEDIARSALRRTKTVSDMRYYWEKILRHTGNVDTASAHTKKSPVRLIHITGTKGKGSTACMCEAILRAHGYSTGLFTSPHLMDIRERIRWNGKPVHPTVFADAYWTVRTALETDAPNPITTGSGSQQDGNRLPQPTTDDPPPLLPGYFRMLTLMGLYSFLHQLPGVDVVVLEVGMGGRYDATNFIDTGCFRSVAHGVTLLDLDHTRILGNTLEAIAWEKGGIVSANKLNPSGTSPRPLTGSATETAAPAPKTSSESDSGETQATPNSLWVLDSNTQGVIDVMRRCAGVEGMGGTLALVDATGTDLRAAMRAQRQQGRPGPSLGLAGDHQYGNATLAVALCRAATKENDDASPPGILQAGSPTTLSALAGAAWPGRCQRLSWKEPGSSSSSGSVEFYMDGAHTPQSLGFTVAWFRSITETDRDPAVLVFNCSHERNPVELMELLLLPPDRGKGAARPRSYSRVYFARSDSSRPSPVARASASSLLGERGIVVREDLSVSVVGRNPTAPETWQETLAVVWKHLVAASGEAPGTVVCNQTAREVWDEIREEGGGAACSPLSGEPRATRVFVTGSLYLVGSFLTALGWEEESSPPLEGAK